jgi:hypothetical protein
MALSANELDLVVAKACQVGSAVMVGRGRKNKQTRGVSHCGLTIYIKKKSILRQKKNYGNSNISPCKNIVFQKNPLKETKILQAIITL